MLKTTGLLFINLVFLTGLSYAQSPIAAPIPDECSEMEYRDPNKTPPAVQNVKNILGTVKLADTKLIRVSSCVALYEEKTQKLVRVVYLSLKQKFEMKGIPDGEYRIVVKEKDGFFCPINVAVKVDKTIVEKTTIGIELKRPTADTCSYLDLKTE